MSESKIIQLPEINDGCQSDQFPIGMQVLAIDANIVSLTYLVALLRKCQYQVTATTKAEEALEYLRQDKEKFDIILIDVVRLDMDGFKLLEIISHETDIPVVMVSINDDQANIMRGISNGAQAFLLKPVRLLEIMNIWQHVVRKNLSASQRSFKVMEQKGPDNPMPFEGDGETMTAREEEADSQSSLNASRTYKKSRLNWTPKLHDKFLSAVKQLGGEEEAKPNHILKVMNVPGLTRENIASHLQKHRVNLRKHNGTASEMANNILSGFDSSTRITASQNVASSDECGLHQANQKLIDRPTRMHDDRDLAGSSFPLMVRYPTSNFHPNKQIIDPQEIAMNVPPLMMSGHGQRHQMNIMHNIHGQEIIPFARQPPMENHFLMQEFELPSTFHPRGIWQNVSLPGIVSHFPSTTNVTTQDIHRRHHHQGGTNNYDEVLFSYPSQMILKDDSAGQKNAISQSASRVPFVSNPNSQMQGPVINMGSRREEETEFGMQLLKIDQFLTAPSDDFQE